MSKAIIIPTFFIIAVGVAFGLGRWTAKDHGSAKVAAAPAPAHHELGIGSCSADEPAPAVATLSDQRVALEPSLGSRN